MIDSQTQLVVDLQTWDQENQRVPDDNYVVLDVADDDVDTWLNLMDFWEANVPAWVKDYYDYRATRIELVTQVVTPLPNKTRMVTTIYSTIFEATT